jgi:ADP-ribosylglycohydrolase
MAHIIAALLWEGSTLDLALDAVAQRLREHRGHEEVLAAVDAARELTASSIAPSPEAVARLGRGWVAEETLAIAVYCALVADDFEHGVVLGVNPLGRQ